MYKTGEHSQWLKHLRGDLRKGFIAARKDSELKGLRDDINLQKGFINELLAKLAEVEPPPWGDAVEAYNDFCTAKTDEAKAAALKELGKVIRSGKGAVAAERVIRAEVRELMQEHTRTEAAEWKRLTDLGSMVTSDQLAQVKVAIIRSMEKYIPDRKAQAAFLRDVVEATGFGPRQIEQAEE